MRDDPNAGGAFDPTTLGADWAAVADAPVGHVFQSWEQDGLRVVVRRGGYSLCAYIGVPPDHYFFGVPYSHLDLDVHGGLTFGEVGRGDGLDEGWWWFGWDYGHAFDYSTRDVEIGKLIGRPPRGPEAAGIRETVWTVPMVAADAADAARRLDQMTVKGRVEE